MKLHKLHIRTRVALWIAIISTGLLVFMALAVYGVFEQQLVSSLDETLALRTASNHQLVDQSTSPPSLRIGLDPGRELYRGEAVLRLYGSDGALLYDASPSTGLTNEENALVREVISLNTAITRTIDLADDEDYRVVGSPIGGPASVDAVLITGIERSRVNGPLRILRIVLVIAIPLTAGGASLGGYWVAQRALRPVSAMVSTATQITHGDLTQRVPGSDVEDELGLLASTLNAMIERLQETVERERRFTADASHELRTPLAAIETGIEVTLAHERVPAEYQRVLTVIREETLRLTRLSNQLLLLSRLDANEIQRTFVPVDLVELAEAMIELFTDDHPNTMIFHAFPAFDVVVMGDMELLARAVLNVMENACVHGGEDVQISLSLQQLENEASLLISDDGPGIPVVVAHEVFQRFRRGDAARTTHGTGLGLSIVQAIVECHGGTVRLLDRQYTTGAHFDIRLPVITPKSEMSEGK